MRTFKDEPDLVYTRKDNRDSIRFTRKGKSSLISVDVTVDDTGCEWMIPVKDLIGLIGDRK